MDKLAKRPLGKTGLNISPFGLGTVKFGRNEGVKYPKGFEIPDEKALAVLLAMARERGVNLIDTAPSYGTSEERLGRLLKGQRHDWIIVGKAGEEFENGKSSYHFTPQFFEMSLQRSLERLNTDYLDVLLIHSDGGDMDILNDDALIETQHDFKKRGVVKAIGASTKTVEGGIKTLELMDVVMATYNPSYIDEKPVLDYAAKHGKGVLLKKALASGHLKQLGNNPVQDAMDFVFAHPGVSGVIIGTIDPHHLRDNIAAVRRATSPSF
jgi:aryl-alcohol dehydrogenase-like predicted oxidoreductase